MDAMLLVGRSDLPRQVVRASPIVRTQRANDDALQVALTIDDHIVGAAGLCTASHAIIWLHWMASYNEHARDCFGRC